MNFFRKNNQSQAKNKAEDDIARENGNEKLWYFDRSADLLFQRKILIIINVIGLIAIIGLVISIFKISSLRKFEPFVIKIDENTGSTSVVKPIDREFLDSKENLTRYFIKKYIIAREGYNPVDYGSYSAKVIRSFSSSNVYSQYNGYIKVPENNLEKKYGDKYSTFVTIKSWSKLGPNKYIVRFDVTESTTSIVYNKVAIVDVTYITTEVSEDNFDINPAGFLITGYNVSDDRS